jgi:hypothetical protein
MKQTAVEWLIANIDWQLLKNTTTHYDMIVEQAKEMEKQQQGYSEEEMEKIFDYWNIFNYHQDSFSGKDDLTFKQWFKQFKKNNYAEKI